MQILFQHFIHHFITTEIHKSKIRDFLVKASAQVEI